jgi:hypothetical protein
MRPEGDQSLKNGAPFDLGALGASAVSSLALRLSIADAKPPGTLR